MKASELRQGIAYRLPCTIHGDHKAICLDRKLVKFPDTAQGAPNHVKVWIAYNDVDFYEELRLFSEFSEPWDPHATLLPVIEDEE